MTWTNINTDANANWQAINTALNPSWQDINTASSGYSVGGVSGACVCEVPISGLTDPPPDWTLIETA